MVFDRGAMIYGFTHFYCLASFPPLVKSDKEAYKIGIDICRS
jgi:hypothetical protein